MNQCRYTYRLGHRLNTGSYVWSKNYSFKAPPFPGQNSLQRIIIFGDTGKVNTIFFWFEILVQGTTDCFQPLITGAFLLLNTEIWFSDNTIVPFFFLGKWKLKILGLFCRQKGMVQMSTKTISQGL